MKGMKKWSARACRRKASHHVQWFPQLSLALMMVSPSAWSACSVSAQSVNFGGYDPFSSRNSDSTGNIAVDCTSGVPYSLALSSGAGTYAARAMSSATALLNYNLYVDVARLVVWGDGTGGSATVGGVGNATTTNVAVYGRIPARQNARVGSYSDSITVTISF